MDKQHNCTIQPSSRITNHEIWQPWITSTEERPGKCHRRGRQGEKDRRWCGKTGTTEALSAKPHVLSSQLEKSNSCAIILNDFNECKNSEFFLRVPFRADRDGPSTLGDLIGWHTTEMDNWDDTL